MSRMSRPVLVPDRGLRRAAAALLVAVAAAAGASPASASAAAERVLTVRGVDGPGPARTDAVRVLQQGPATARKVLVLMPGTSASASYFAPVARDLIARLPGWQVWSVARRETALEDTSVLDEARTGAASAQRLFDYYLGWLGNPQAGADHFRPVTDAAVPYARRWGLRVAIGDLQRVVALARHGGRTVVLGGHSLGGAIAEAYATWDFAGRAGARDLGGLVLIDGAGGGRGGMSVAAAREGLAKLAKGSPFADLTGTGLPWAAGVFNAVGARLALSDPGAPSLLQAWPFLPAFLHAPVRVTNAAAYGYAVDTQTGPRSLALVQAHLGGLAPAGDPRPWQDGGLVPVARMATVFSGIRGLDGSSWYHPVRLSLDAAAIDGGRPIPAQTVLGVRTVHAADARLPIYAFATALGGARVLDAARTLAQRAHVPGRDVVLVDRRRTYAHLDPLAATAVHNDFVRTLVPFLRRIR